MIIKEIVQIGNPAIRKKSRELTDKEIESSEIKDIIKDLVDSMYHYNLIGISAPQINHNVRILITEIRKTKNRKTDDLEKLIVFINPQITFLSKEKNLAYEGCGSVADSNLFGLVERSNSIKIKAQDINGEWFDLEASELLARVIQHEYDHLDGILFTDRVTDTKSYMSGSEYRKEKKE
jgi:peptide deformylase